MTRVLVAVVFSLSTAVASDSAFPVPERDMTAGSMTFKGKLQVGDQAIPVDVSIVTKLIGANWAVTESLKGSMGPTATDMVLLDKSKLVPRERHSKQGSVAIDLSYSDTAVTGTVTNGSSTKPVDLALSEPAFADGAGSVQSIATLPLSPTYQASFSNVDLSKMQVQKVDLRVTGTETVTVPAGTFECYRVEVGSGDHSAKTTYWVAKEARRTAKYESVLPDLHAQLTAELAQ